MTATSAARTARFAHSLGSASKREKFLATTAMASALGLLALYAQPAHAQTVGCNLVGDACVYSTQGTPTWDGKSSGDPGTPGGDAPGYSLDVEGSPYLFENGNLSAINATSRGGDGEQGSNTTSGATGGKGGRGGDVTVTVGTHVSGAAPSGANNAMTISSMGGTGGYTGKGNLNNGNADAIGIGGDAGNVTATLDGIFNSQARSVVVSSTGGTGGRGRYWGAGLSGQGADGAAGGNAGTVTATFNNASGDVNNNGFIGTSGVLVESVGGTGGGGGTAEDIDGSQGGKGGKGGNGNDVNVTVNSAVRMTEAADSDAALHVLSMGGTGGQGNSSGGSAGAGGAGGNAGNVALTFAGSGGVIAANGTYSPGVLVQSLGGNGGDGGTPSKYVIGPNGGAGADAGTSGTVSVTGSGLNVRTGQVDSDPTKYEGSPGLLAQSIGGGGGSGGGATGVFAIGGDGGIGVNGNAVNVALQSTVETFGYGSDGLAAQSIGGGGGKGGDVTGTSAGFNYVVGGTGGGGGNGHTASLSSQAGSSVTTHGDHAPGLLVQSIGGGGGQGGAAYSSVYSAGVGVSMSVGGSGGAGGDACFTPDADHPGTACSGTTAVNAGSVATNGIDSYGILAQSIGGGGGAGGASTAKAHVLAVEDVAISVTSTMGGTGGGGGSGGLLTATNNGLVTTSGSGAVGMLAQSIGGGGGTGGDSSSTSSALSAGYAITASSSLGGSGGGGGNGGSATATNSGLILTTGQAAGGMLVQSVGGGGGAGGSGDGEASSNDEAEKKITVSFALGGSGKGGGDGYAATANNIGGSIITLGDGAFGIGAQSIGGGGGAGGGAAASATGDYTATVSVGAKGGAGGSTYHTDGNGTEIDGVTVLNDAKSTVVTYGADANGIIAQSIGGGGGVGGKAASNIATSKSDGDGGNGGSTSAGAISKLQSAYDANGSAALNSYLGLNNAVSFTNSLLGNSTGLNAISDGDVDGALNDAAESKGETEDNTESKSISLNIGVGASGGSGGAAGLVTVTNNGQVATLGNDSDAILAQAIGGGGGKGGAASTATSNDYSGNLAVGGSGAGGGYGGTVNVTNTGKVYTGGALAAGIVGQSIAGGGGIGGASASSVTTESKDSGNEDADDGAFKSLSLSIGGHGGASYAAGAVTVANSGAISTSAHDSTGIIAQSISGGGGIVKTLATNLEGAGGSASAKGTDYDIKLALGGSAGTTSGGSGAINVTTTQGGAITTQGDDSYGILAQSISGGGGLVLGGKPEGTTAADFFGSGSSSGNVSGAVSVSVGDNITTTGKGAIGIVAQSIGGGGGIAGDTGWTEQFFGMSGDTQRTGNGGDIAVSVKQGATVSTSADNTPAIWVQSIGGGGGRVTNKNGAFIGTAGGTGTAGNIDVDIAGTVQATGYSSLGVFAQSEGGDTKSNSPIQVNVASTGKIQVGTPNVQTGLNGTSAGIYIDHGGMDDAHANTVTNDGQVLTYGSVSNSVAVYSTGGYTKVINNGTMMGDVLLTNGGGSGCFTNNGVYGSGDVVQVGACGVTNSGTFVVGAPGKMATTTIDGNFVQQAGGVLQIDADLKNGTADKLVVNGTATVGGTVQVQPVTVSNKPVTVLTATGGVTLDPQLKQTDNSALFDFPVSVSGNSLQVQAQARFNDVASTMGHNQQAVAANLQTLFDNGSDMGGGFSALSKLSDAQSVQKGFNTLSGQTLGAIGAFRFNSSRTFVNNMNSGCVAFDGSGGGSSCAWARAAGGTADQDATPDALGYHANAQIYQLGAGIDLSPHWQLSGSAAYEASKFRDDDRTAQIKGSTLEAGAELRYHNGPLEVSGAVDGAYGWYDSHRTIAIGDIEDVAASNPNEWQVGAHAQASYTLSLGKAYVKPFADLHAIYVHADGYTETGSSPFNLTVADQGNLGISGAAGVELGGKFKVGSATVRPFVSAAWERLGNNDWTTTARFAGQPDADPFDAQTAGPSQLGRFNAGLDILGSKKIDLSLQYSTELGDHYSSQAGVARVTFHF